MSALRRQFLIAVASLWLSGTACRGDILAEFPISPFENDIIAIPVNAGDGEYLFAVDSGATNHVFDPALKHLLHRQLASLTVGTAHGKPMEVERFSSASLAAGDISDMGAGSVLCTDLSTIRDETGYDVKGILGIPLFRTHIVQVNFQSKIARIIKCGVEPRPEWGQPIAVVTHHGRDPQIELVLEDGSKVLCLVDTGSGGELSLRSELFDSLVETGQLKEGYKTAVGSINGEAQCRTGVLASVRCSSDLQANVEVLQSFGVNLVGVGYLRRYNVTFDFPRSTMYLSPNKSYRVTPPTGLTRQRTSEGIRVDAVDPKSPASRAGFMVNDVIIDVNGKSVQKHPTAEVYSWFYAGEEVAVTVLRNGTSHSLKLRFED